MDTLQGTGGTESRPTASLMCTPRAMQDLAGKPYLNNRCMLFKYSQEFLVERTIQRPPDCV